MSSWLFGVDLQAISRSCGSALLCSYDSDAGQTGRDMATSRAELDSGYRAYTGMRAFTLEYAGNEVLLQKVGASLQAGSGGFVF